ncbi:hypothetical protein DXG01_013712 [Tephrocybe rancida]|nr:hypothetical protein DXG01_013712 [Tephrocybe rancida]
MAFIHDFGTVAELLQCAGNILEVSCFSNYTQGEAHVLSKVFEFLHENRIAHNDFISENCGVNVLADTRASYLSNMREPSEVRYAVYDFGASFILRPDADIETAMVMPLYVGEEPGKQQHPLFNPFHGDIEKVGRVLGRYVRVLEATIPSLGPFFDSMTAEDPASRPSASQALFEFRRICSSLTPTQLSSEFTGRLWEKGRIITKTQYPMELPESPDSLF